MQPKRRLGSCRESFPTSLIVIATLKTALCWAAEYRCLIQLLLRHRGPAYLTDCHEIPQRAVEPLRYARLELLIIDCLRPQPHQTHPHLELTLKYIKLIEPRLAVLTRMGHSWDFLHLTRELLSRGVKNTLLARDGQQFLYS
jgi:hypothetical protein